MRSRLTSLVLLGALASVRGASMQETGFYYDDGLPNEGGSLCTATVDEERSTEWGENTDDPQFQMYFTFPNWVANMQARSSSSSSSSSTAPQTDH